MHHTLMHHKADAGRMPGMLYLTGAFSLAGTSVIAARLVSGYLGTFTITAISLLFAVASLLPFCLSSLNTKIQNLTSKDWGMLLLQAVFGIFLFRLFLLQGLQRTSAGESGILTGATPAITAFLSVLMLREPMYKKRFIGLVITIAGIMLVQGFFLPFRAVAAGHFIGNLLVLCAAACESLFNVLSRFGFASAATGRKVQRIDAQKAQQIDRRKARRIDGQVDGQEARQIDGRKAHIDPVLQTLLVSFIAFLLCLIPAAAEKPLRPLMSLGSGQWLALLWYGAIVTAVAFYFWYEGIKRSEASVAAVFSGMMPFTALLLSVLILGERPVWQQYSGAALIIAGMVISGFSRKSAATGILSIESSGDGGDSIGGTKNNDPAPDHL